MEQNGKNRGKRKQKSESVQRHTPEELQRIAGGFLRIVDKIPNPRTRECRYPLDEILLVALVATLCGAESYENMATFGEAQAKWFRQFVPLANGVPAHDTFRRVLILLKPTALDEAYREILPGLRDEACEHVAIDGKGSNGCYDIKSQTLLRMVSAWDTENGLSLGQVATKNDEGKDVGEFHAIPKLVNQLDIRGLLVTVDAGGCYAQIVDAIVAGGGDYTVTLKENQPTFHKMAKAIFTEHEQNDFADVACFHEANRGHGREEQRTYYAVPVPADDQWLKKWRGIASLVMGKFQRSVGGKTSEFTRYYITSLPADAIQRLGRSLRRHWGIENRLHWVLDVTFGEDANRNRRGNAAENLSILRRWSLAMLRQVKGKKTIPNVKYQATVDPHFRTEIMKICFVR